MRLLTSLAIFLTSVSAFAAETTITWHGHAAFEIKTPKGKVLMIDPWLSNPSNPNSKTVLNSINKVDYIFITHGHSDHVGDAVALGKKTKARLVASFELANNLVKASGYPANQIGFDTLGNPGGELPLADGEVTAIFTPAVHSSGMDTGKGPMIYGGNPVGFVLKIKDGPTIYHTGDTAYFSDMKLIGENYAPDLALINIGGHFGMEAPMAAKAVEAVKAKVVVPHHYKTFPILTQDAKPFAKLVADEGAKAVVMEPGKSIVFEGTKLKQ